MYRAVQEALTNCLRHAGAQSVRVDVETEADVSVTEANLAAGGLLGKSAPPFVALSALAVSHENVLEAWEQVYHSDPPAEVVDSYAD